MSRTQQYISLILKKQPYGEGDEIITLFTKEAGKLRAMGKSTKLSKSKLQYSLQVLFLVRITVTGSNSLPKIIGAEVVDTFSTIREGWGAITMAQYAIELLIKFTPDEQKHEQLFDLVSDYFSFLNTRGLSSQTLAVGLAKFKIALLQTLGFGIGVEPTVLSADSNALWFSNTQGNFTLNDNGDQIPVSKETLNSFKTIEQTTFPIIVRTPPSTDLFALQELLSNFLTYQLELDIRSERFMGM